MYGSRCVPSLRDHRSRDFHSLNRLQSDENRGNLLEANFPQTVVTLLESYSESIPPKRRLTDPLPIHPEDLKIVKTAIGVILNISLGYGRSSTSTVGNLLTTLSIEPVRTRLLSLEVAITILRISTAIYPTGSWLHFRSSPSDAEQGFEPEDWELRAGLSSWAWRALNGLKVEANEGALFDRLLRWPAKFPLQRPRCSARKRYRSWLRA